MSYYVAAYDTEGVFPWWDRDRRQRGFSYTPEHITEFLNGVRAVADVHLQRDAPASFFLVAKMLELAGPELRAILDNPLFDIQCHSFTHPNLIALGEDRATLQYELGDAKKLIEDTFGRAVTGLTAPGGYTDGFRGHPLILDVMWEAGYRYVRRRCGKAGYRAKGHPACAAGSALLVCGGWIPGAVGNAFPCLARQHPHRTAGNCALAAAAALALSHRDAPRRARRLRSLRARHRLLRASRGFSTTCPSFTPGRSIGSTSRPPRSGCCSIMPARRWSLSLAAGSISISSSIPSW